MHWSYWIILLKNVAPLDYSLKCVLPFVLEDFAVSSENVGGGCDYTPGYKR